MKKQQATTKDIFEQLQKMKTCNCPDFGYYVISGNTFICSRCNRHKPESYKPNEAFYKPLPTVFTPINKDPFAEWDKEQELPLWEDVAYYFSENYLQHFFMKDVINTLQEKYHLSLKTNE